MASEKSSGLLDKARASLEKLLKPSGGAERRVRVYVISDQIYIHPLSLLDNGRAWTSAEPITKIARNAVEDTIGQAILTALKFSKTGVQSSNGAFERKMVETAKMPDWQTLTQRALCVQIRTRDKVSVVQPMRVEHGIFSRVDGKELHGDLTSVKLGHLLVESLFACE